MSKGMVGWSTNGLLAACACLFGFCAAIAPAQETPGSGPSPVAVATSPPGPVDDFERGTPRSTMRAFLATCSGSEYERGQHYLDLRRIPPAARSVRGPEFARQLCIIIERTVWIDPELLSDSPEGDREDGLPPRRENVALLKPGEKPVRLLLERIHREDGALIWKIAADTVARVPELYQEFGYGPLEHYLPESFFETRVAGVPVWQWISLVALSLLAWTLSIGITNVLVRFGRLLITRSWVPLSEESVAGLRRPLHWLLAAQLFGEGIEWLNLSVRTTQIAESLIRAGSWILVAWCFLRAIDGMALMLQERATNRQVVAALLPLGRRAAKSLAVILTSLAALQNLGFHVTSLVAGLGIGGLAVALAGQRTLEHLFGGITLVADQPVRVGEFCRFGDKVGTVIDIGLRSTWLRTPDRTLLSIPNGQFASMQIENFSRRDRMRFSTTLNLHHDATIEQLHQVLNHLRKTLTSHPKVFPDSGRVSLVGFGTRSFDIEISAYVRTTSLGEFNAIREELLLEFLRVIHEHGTRLAFA